MSGGIFGRIFRRKKAAEKPPVVRLEDVRRRLELLLAAVYGRPIPIATVEPPPPPTAWERLTRRAPAHLRAPDEVAASDAERIHLPRELEAPEGEAAAIARYRLLAVEQAERLTRGTVALAPADDPLVRDLYLLAESAAVDRSIASTVPGIFPALAPERAASLARRPALDALTPAEREVESLVRSVLSADPEAPNASLAAGDSPEESLAWARGEADRLRAGGERYRGLPPVGAWGTVIVPKLPAGVLREVKRDDVRGLGMRGGMAGSGGEMENRGDGRGKETGRTPGSKTKKASEQVLMEDAEGEIPDDSDDDRPENAAAPKKMGGGSGARRGAVDHAAEGGGAEPEIVGVPYPEWDAPRGQYRRPGVVVRVWPADELDGDWAGAVLAEHPALMRRMREQFERLRARRTRLNQQREGEELDLAACVRALVDQRTGHTVDDRLYVSVRPARRELAILLLVDISGSTTDHVSSTLRIIDVEKIALLLSSEAFDALGDRYAIHTFSGRGAGNVRVRTVKDFAERNGERVRKRIAALNPEGYTRLGAAVRHASALLERQGAAHQLLLILSDGKPNDEDEYASNYGVEDARQAIAEARALGVYPFCITVDKKGSGYLKRIFGASGHMVLRQPEQLPQALLKLVRHLLAT